MRFPLLLTRHPKPGSPDLRRQLSIAIFALLCLAAIERAQICQGAITYPHIAAGGGYETVLTITNPTNQKWIGRIGCFQGDYQSFTSARINGATVNPYIGYEISPSRTSRFVITGDSNARSGFLTVTTVTGPSDSELATSVYFRLSSPAGKPTDMVSTSSVQPARRWVFPVDRSADADTGFACVVPTSSSSNPELSFSLLAADGTPVQQVKKQQRGHAAYMIAEIFNSIPANFIGSVVVDSPIGIYPLVLRLDLSGGTIQLTGTSPARMAPRDHVTRLAFRPHDAAYSKALDRIIAVSANPNRLHIYDPLTNDHQIVELDRLPECVAVDEDGDRAVIGHDGWLTVVDLTTRTVTAVWQTQDKPARIQLAGLYAYLPGKDHAVVSIGLESGDRMVAQNAGDAIRLHPDGKLLYTLAGSYGQMRRFALTDGVLTLAATVNQTNGGDLWFSADGSRIFLNAGQVYKCKPIPAEDMVKEGQINNSVGHIAHSLSLGRVAVIRRWTGWEPGDTSLVFLYNDQSLELKASYELPSFLPDRFVTSSAHFVFFNNASTAMSVIVQAGPEGGLLNDFGVVVLKPGELE
jgi:hypothetical protein